MRTDRALLLVLAPLWLLAVALHLDRQIAAVPLAWVPLYVTPSAEHPIVSGWWPETPDAERVLEPGDRLLRVGEHDMRGAGRFALWARMYAAASPDLGVPVEVERAGVPMAATVQLRRMPFPWQTVPLSLALGLSALLALARGRGAPAARAYALGALAYSFQWSFLFGGRPWTTYAGLGLFFAAGAFYQPLTLRAALAFPESVAVRARWPYAACWLFAITSFGLWVWLFGSPVSGASGLRILSLSYGIWIAVFLGVLAWNYRRADTRGRRQLRWVLYGFYVGLGPALLGSIAFGARPELRGVYELSLVSTVLIPPCLYVAFLAYHLFDINRLITTTAAYSILAPAAFFLLFRVGLPVAEWTSGATGLGRGLALWLAAVLIATPVPLLATLLRPQLDRLLFREQFHFETAVRALRAELSRVEGPGALFEAVGRGVAAALPLESLAIYVRSGALFAPVHRVGTGAPIPLHVAGPLGGLLAATPAPADAQRLRQWIRSGTLAPSERAALEGLAVEAVVPIRRRDELIGFLCLGEKSSGDLFTRADLALLDGLCERLSTELDRYEEERRLREQRALHEKLALYAPGTFRTELARGTDVTPGAREVTVVFVALRGYGPFFERAAADEIFRAVDACTSAVSRIIRDHGGTVVEFHAEGLMAAFGAPSEVADKEAAAVAAAREAWITVAGLRGDATIGVALEAGVGIATGEAFVGHIQAVDRKIWGVIGNTTNLAARLQAQTQGLNAAIVLDDTTRARAGRAAADFEARSGIRLKGRSEEFTVYTLPLAR